jgi:hypothetical protein
VSEELRIGIGIMVVPVLNTNFGIGPNGDNPLAEAIHKMCAEVLNSTSLKLQETAAAMCAAHSVELVALDTPVVLEQVKACIEHAMARGWDGPVLELEKRHGPYKVRGQRDH